MKLSPKMGFIEWDDEEDPYDFQQLVGNWNIADFHDHTPGRGVPVPRGGIAAGAIGPNELGSDIPWVPNKGPAAQRPSAGLFGRMWYSTDTDAWSLDTGTVWESFVGANFVKNLTGGAGTGVDFGATAISWPGGSTVSNTLTISHHLGVNPSSAQVTPLGAFTNTDRMTPWVVTVTGANLQVKVASANTISAGSYGQVSWLVIA